MVDCAGRLGHPAVRTLVYLVTYSLVSDAQYGDMHRPVGICPYHFIFDVILDSAI